MSPTLIMSPTLSMNPHLSISPTISIRYKPNPEYVLILHGVGGGGGNCRVETGMELVSACTSMVSHIPWECRQEWKH